MRGQRLKKLVGSAISIIAGAWQRHGYQIGLLVMLWFLLRGWSSGLVYEQAEDRADRDGPERPGNALMTETPTPGSAVSDRRSRPDEAARRSVSNGLAERMDTGRTQ